MLLQEAHKGGQAERRDLEVATSVGCGVSDVHLLEQREQRLTGGRDAGSRNGVQGGQDASRQAAAQLYDPALRPVAGAPARPLGVRLARRRASTDPVRPAKLQAFDHGDQGERLQRDLQQERRDHRLRHLGGPDLGAAGVLGQKLNGELMQGIQLRSHALCGLAGLAGLLQQHGEARPQEEVALCLVHAQERGLHEPDPPDAR
mmetsp:Transcript_83065/g.247822  ORF Transcript_83065/g.247822 Transcript_83065/m.247822 type:complete len:203 (-) Transcript_83065:81-689(-)